MSSLARGLKAYALVAVIAAIAYHRAELLGVLRLAVQLRAAVGVPRALLISLLLRFNYLAAWPEARAALDGAVVDDEAFFAFPNAGAIAVLFLPGGGVEEDAYAPLLRALAQSTSATVVCLRLPSRHPMMVRKGTLRKLMAKFPAVRRWVLAGHSLGAGSFGAAGLAHELLSDRKPLPGEASLAGLLMLAGAVTGKVDLSGHEALRCLAILASEDTIVNPDGNAEDGSSIRGSIERRCPPGTQLEIIDGGNHAGFAHYGPQTFPRADGLRRISTEEQQRQTVELAATFIASFETDATATADVTDDAEVRSDAI